MLFAVLILLSGCNDTSEPLADPLLGQPSGELPRPITSGDPGLSAATADLGATDPGSIAQDSQLFWLQSLVSELESELTEEEASALASSDAQISLDGFNLAKTLDGYAQSLLAGFRQDPPALEASLVDAVVAAESAIRVQVMTSIAKLIDTLRPELREKLAGDNDQQRTMLIDAGAVLIFPHAVHMRQLIHDSGAERVRPMLALIQEDADRSQALTEATNAYEQELLAIDLAGEAPGAAMLEAYRTLDVALQESMRARLKLGLGLLAVVSEEARVNLLTNMAFASYTAMMMEGASWGVRFSLTTQSMIPIDDNADRPEMPEGEAPPLEGEAAP